MDWLPIAMYARIFSARYYTGDGKMHCPCHEGLFDAATGNVLAGPPIRPLPLIQLARQNGIIYAVKEIER